MAKVVGTWEGGRVLEKADGTHVYYIRKRIKGKLYEVSTGCTKLKPALAQWERFQTNPEGFDPSGALPGTPLTIRAFKDAYVAYCASKGNSKNWITQKRRYLGWWGRVFPADLRTATREKLLALCEGESVPHNRIAALKAFCSWLRDVKGLLPKGEDATLDMSIPALKPAQWTAPRAISRDVYLATLAKLDDTYRDVVLLLGGTGCHVQEALRLSQGQGSIVGTTLTVFHKNGQQHRMEVSPEIARAAMDVYGRKDLKHPGRKGGFCYSRLLRAIHEACDQAKVPRWAPGGLRHSFVSWMIADGASIEAVAAYTNHDVATLKRYYNVAAIPRPVVPVALPKAS